MAGRRQKMRAAAAVLAASAACVTYLAFDSSRLAFPLSGLAIAFGILTVTAPHETTPVRALAPQLFGAAGWAYFFAAVPTAELVAWALYWVPVLAFLEWRRVRRYRFLPGAPVRLIVTLVLIAIAARAPTKWLDRRVGPFLQTRMTLGGLEATAGGGYLLTIPDVAKARIIDVPRKAVSIRELVRLIEDQTALRHDIGWCGTGASVLYGAHPIGPIRFRVEQ